MTQWKNIWNGMSKDSTMHQLLDRTRHCEGIALDVCGDTLDYQQLHERSDAAAAWLQSQGLQKRAIIILSMRASVDLFCMMAAVMKAGFTVAVTEDVIPEAIAFLYLLGNAERYGNRGK
jgi:non-ribosomal peptide synthetase component E (peptide arylation enzyme)